MAIPTATHQVASNAVAALSPGGPWISLHTAPAGTTGDNEAFGGSYTRMQSPMTPDGLGNNNGNQVGVPCPPGTYVEAGYWTTETGDFLAIPTGVSATGSSSGGALPAGATYWVVTATNFSGETLASAEVSATLTGSTSSSALSCTAVTGATGYNWYRSHTSGSGYVLVGSTTTNSFTDTGAAGTAVSPPATNTASTFIFSNAFTTGPQSVSGANPVINVNPAISA